MDDTRMSAERLAKLDAARKSESFSMERAVLVNTSHDDYIDALIAERAAFDRYREAARALGEAVARILPEQRQHPRGDCRCDECEAWEALAALQEAERSLT
jgi:hypothetical protein